MTDGKAKAAEPSLFQGLASSPAREATRRATRRFCKLLQPTHEYYKSIIVRKSSCTGYNGTRGGSR